jgi:hypothetical protein
VYGHDGEELPESRVDDQNPPPVDEPEQSAVEERELTGRTQVKEKWQPQQFNQPNCTMVNGQVFMNMGLPKGDASKVIKIENCNPSMMKIGAAIYCFGMAGGILPVIGSIQGFGTAAGIGLTTVGAVLCVVTLGLIGYCCCTNVSER